MGGEAPTLYPDALQFWRSPDATTNADDSLKRYASARRRIYDNARQNRAILMLSEQDGESTSFFIVARASEAVIIFRDVLILPPSLSSFSATYARDGICRDF